MDTTLMAILGKSSATLELERITDHGGEAKSSAALQDAQPAVGMVRARAAEWHIDPQRSGVLGFSAGAHLSAAVSAHFEHRACDSVDAADRLACRPDFAVIVYPDYLALAEQNFAPNPEIHVTSQTPPSFIVHTEDDPVHLENATLYFLSRPNFTFALKEAMATDFTAQRSWSPAGRLSSKRGCTPSRSCRLSLDLR
jgi:hypothetical protein